MEESRTDAPFWRLLAIFMIAECVAAVGILLVIPGLPVWLRVFKSPVTVGWLASSYLLVSAVAAALLARIGDLVGRKPVLLCAITVTLIGSLVAVAASSPGMLIAGRAMQGFAGAVMPLCFGLARELLPRKRVPLCVGLMVGTGSIGAALGMLASGAITDAYGPDRMFWVLAAVSAVALVAVQLGLPREPWRWLETPVDWVGGIVMVPAIAGILIAISYGKSWGWAYPPTLMLLAGGLVILAGWIRYELRHPDPLIQLRLLADRNCAAANLIMVFASLGVMQLPEMMSFLIQQPVWTGVGLGLGATIVGVAKLPAISLGAVSSIISGTAISRWGAKPSLVTGSALLIAAAIAARIEHGSLTGILIAIGVSSLGLTAIYTGVSSLILESAPPERSSEATGLMQVFRSTFQGVGAQLLAMMLASSWLPGGHGEQYPTAQAYGTAIMWMIVSSVIALALALTIRSTLPTKGSHRPQSPRADPGLLPTSN